MIKCHTCQKELSLNKENNWHNYYECPDLHILNVEFDNEGIAMNYILFWDDVEKDLRFRLEANQNHTELRSRPLLQRKLPDHLPGDIAQIVNKRWETLMTMDHFFPLILKDDTPQVENLFHRLLKLKAFA